MLYLATTLSTLLKACENTQYIISIKGWKFLKKLWCRVGGGNKVINLVISTKLKEGPLYLFWKQLHVKVIGLFTHHEKFEKELHIHRKK